MTTIRTDAPPRPWTRARRCPVCRGSGCLLSSTTDPAAVVCSQVESPQPIGTTGFLHVLRDGPAWAPWRLSLVRLARMEDSPR